ncbi:hypothetical protein RF11_16043 [Thelohanellus kitauei]|uniref:Uncharacterized protein n=1 Tax=Thelohanellus kitauei TaxID=669202 RepID=A0A0C2IMD7_THEKT|nr:hypothetical protein RF11_16043 [Thelohanellus kitauei]
MLVITSGLGIQLTLLIKKIQGSHERRGQSNNLRLGISNLRTRDTTYNQPTFPDSHDSIARYPVHPATTDNSGPLRASTYRYRRPTRTNFATPRVDQTPHVNYIPNFGIYQPIPYLATDFPHNEHRNSKCPKSLAKKRNHNFESSSGDESHVDIVMKKTKNIIPIMIDNKKESIYRFQRSKEHFT